MKNISELIINTIKKENIDLQDHILSSETELYGGKSSLDSLGLVNFIVALEQDIEDQFDIIITIADDKAMSLKNSPFRTIGSLEQFINDKISNDE
jgi:acyl carrier protein|tara:strand:- start:23043 stop:23327 length:285 start_codon:yes stop_codon:yes gene_type:complete